MRQGQQQKTFVCWAFVQGDTAFKGAFEEIFDVVTRIDAQKEKKPLSFILKKALVGFANNKSFVVSNVAAPEGAGRPLNIQTLWKSFMGGKSKQAVTGQTMKALTMDSHNNHKMAQSLVKLNKLLNLDGSLGGGLKDVDFF